ncbi:YbdK family carboxylate-amine ligase [Kosakonia sacchari]|uniref:YbdK family carboxylate-amine ligase n=1 Tax=Kosakonia sacchari TaxID=1158459 RepID=UPI0025B23208|nr:YbdK family carboxylate-amine ligase [Kosakonia sacchari]MDN2485810.1 YbdK family carboxylate-amine ligase [Kosakonia sacchari]
MPLPDFHVSEPFTLGIELELQVVNPPGYDLSQDSSRLIEAVKHQISAGEVKHDITESMLEIATGVCRDINQAAHQFSAMQHVILQAASEHHVQICGGGTHPFQKWQRQEICNDERYSRTLETFGYLMQQATVFGQHVHVGCTNGDDAIYLLHGLSRFVPHFIALSAASPYIQGTDTRYASSRLNIFSSFPDNGPMPWVANWQEFEGLFRRLSYTSMIESIKDLHWDIRPSPHFGTVEVRVMDTPLTLSHAVNVAGFIQALSHWLLTERPFKHQPQDYLLYKFNRFQACRYGLEGLITDVHTGERYTIADDLTRLLEKLAPSADKLNAGSALDELANVVKRGKSEAQMMREFIADGGSLIGLMQKHAEIWAAG